MKEVIYKNVFPVGYYTKEENKMWFVKRLRADIMKAVELWDQKYKTAYQIEMANDFSEMLPKMKAKFEKFAELHWKTENRRTEYVQIELAKWIAERTKAISTNSGYYGITFFDIDLEPWSNGIHGSCILSVNNLSDEKLLACWEDIKDNEYFMAADGWQFENGTGRPQIKLHLPKELQKKFKDEEQDLSDAIANFYKGCTYFGD